MKTRWNISYLIYYIFIVLSYKSLHIFCYEVIAPSDLNSGSTELHDRILTPSTTPEIYFNGSAYIRFTIPVSLKRHIGLSFRTCTGGELFSQQYKDYSVILSVHNDRLSFIVKTPIQQYDTYIQSHRTLLDNRWHTVNIIYKFGNLTLYLDNQSQLIANSTYNEEIINNPEFYNERAVLILGKRYTGCILEGPSLVFNKTIIQSQNAVFGLCSMSTESCTVRQEMSLTPAEVSTEDYCITEPCMRHGQCINHANRYECRCTARYTSKNCEFDLGSPCARKLCLNGATCTEDVTGDYKCTCLPDFTGRNCENELRIHSLCEKSPCQNNGTCMVPNGANKYECICSPGFMGAHCEVNINECLSNPCKNGGVCIDGNNNFTCNCQSTGYKGHLCEQNINECEQNPCQHNGVCFDTYGGYICNCQPGFHGENCEQNINECVSSPCSNGGMCMNINNTYECHCLPGYTGNRCQDHITICLSVQCPVHSQCVETEGVAQCVCKPGYYGLPGKSPNCTESTLCAANPCGNGGTCIPVRDTFECICPTGFTGPYCEGVDRCRLQPCMNEGTCIQDDHKYRCLCVEGFTGRNCEQQIRCTDKPCKYVASCKDYVGGYHCTCMPGWTGFNCDIEIDECLSLPCQNGASCINGPNEFYCHCLPGFTGKTCNYNIDDCASTPCQNGGKCIDKINGFICNCTDMWMGTICERPYNICEMLQPCQNNATCSTNIHNKKSYTCNCLPGFEGPTCAINIEDCVGVVCPTGRECVDGINSYECRCPRGFSGENCTVPVNSCADANLCVNGTCVVTDTGYKCECVQGFTGKHCEVDIDECVFPGICHNGICVNRPGDFQCYCEPGYTGDRCDTDFDECLSHPCKNGATCLNKINKFECICPPGYTSIDCSVDINECDSNPCVEGSTCINGIASYYCKCQPGLTGARCEINIDDCVSSPCLNSGLCVDGLNNYTCNCDNTGFVGDHCEINIDDCISNPCTNGAQCEDGVNNYTCKCFPGYNGKNCEIDINECLSNPCQYGGTCLQRSNTSLYQPAIQKEFAFELPRIFKSKFTYSNASGYECICVPGITGENCQININECEDNPCNNGGQCHDKIGYYVCECDPGFEGTHCEHDVDECATLKPCVHGTCIDGRANYFCDCKPEYGGKNCSVELIACKKENACLNDGKCKPYVENEVTHKYNCTCTNGFHGDRCEKITTMSLNGSSYVMVNTSRDEGYDIQFRFKTTLANGLLAIGKGLTYYILELVNRRLNLRSSLLNKWEGVFIGSALNDSNWQKVFVAINSSHLVLAANEEQTIYPINLNEASNSSHTTFPTTYLGGTVANHRHLAHSPPFFVGCMQDVVINSEWVLPENEPTALAGPVSIVNVQVGCFREPQCNPNPCHSGGHCTDLWQTFSCTCERPYLGKTCQYNFTAATFSHENTTNSLVTVTVTESARRAVRSISHISMFIRTRQNRGQIFYLGSAITSVDLDDETYIAAQLESGELLVKIQFNKTPEAHTVGGVKLDNGYNHLIEVIRNVTLIQVKLNGTEYFRKTIGATGQLDVQMMYLGGLPQVSRPVRQADPTASATTVQHRAELNTNVTNYKGIIQDVQISNGNLTMVVEFFPLRAENLVIPPSFGSVSFEKNSILEGVISDDMCRVNPCERNGTCYNTWNDFSCHCPLGFKGKTCQEVEFCQLQDCPTGSVCRNLNDGYECIANATFDGKSTSLSYNFVTLNTTKPKFDSIEISYRTNDGGTLFHAINGQEYFIISVNRDNITTQWKLNGRPEIHKFKKDAADGNWTTLIFTIKDNIIKGGFKDLMMEDMPNLITQDFDANAFDNLISRSTIILGGGYYHTDKENVVDYDVKYVKTSYRTEFYTTENMMLGNNAVEIPNTSLGTGLDLKVGANFKGCLGEIRVGKYLLAYYLIDDLYDKNKTGPEYFSLLTNKNHNTGCLLCFDTDCKNNGHCLNPEIEYTCDCPPGFEANDCSVNINECMNNLCKNNSSCIDGIANYTCKCEIGWEGWLCDQEINECLSEPCLNGGTCVDLLGSYECQCPNTYIGSQCESLRLITCDNQPCLNGSTCVDKKNLKTANNFTCICAPGFEGAFCDIPYCMISICQHGFCNVDRPSPMCECEVGFTGKYCEENINECLTPNGSSPCLNKGTCIDGIGSYTCNCNSTGYTGDTCEIDIDECTLYSEKETCGPTGKCINIPGTYKCSCPIGYCGNGCNHQNPCYILQMLEGDIEQSDFVINDELCGLHGTCNEDCGHGPNHVCICEEGFGGDNCTSPEVGEQGGSSAIDIAVIVVPIMAVLLLLAAAGLAVFIAMARSKRATRGTYSPSAQEFCNPRVEMDHVLKPPPEERLI